MGFVGRVIENNLTSGILKLKRYIQKMFKLFSDLFLIARPYKK